MHLSKFNLHVKDDDGTTIIYNTFSNKAIKIDDKILDAITASNFDCLPNKVCDYLNKRIFLNR